LFVADQGGNRVRKIALNSNIITTVAGDGTANFNDMNGVPATSVALEQPYGIFADQSSNLFIADYFGNRVLRVDASTGLIAAVAGTGVYDFTGDGPSTSVPVSPLDITIDRSQMMYISDSSGRIRSAPVVACFFTLSAPTVTVVAGGSTGSITIQATDSSCPYAISSSSPFVTITSSNTGTGSGIVSFSVSAATGPGRTATVNIGGAAFTVTQAGTLSAPYNIGFFQPSGPVWAIESNGNGVFDAGDRVFPFAGQAGAIVVTGDWNGMEFMTAPGRAATSFTASAVAAQRMFLL